MIQQICTFYLNGSFFGVEIEDVQEIIQQPPLTRIPLASPEVCGLINLRGQIIPVVDLSCRLALRSSSCTIDHDNQTIYNVIVKTREDTVSFIVDDIGDIVSCPSETFEPPPATLNAYIRAFLKGAYKLEQDVLLVLNTTKILD